MYRNLDFLTLKILVLEFKKNDWICVNLFQKFHNSVKFSTQKKMLPEIQLGW
jgi:hypothetical protein